MRSLLVLFAMAVTFTAYGAEPSATVRVPAFERVVLGNGAVLLLMPSHEVPLIAFQAVIRGGGVTDPADKPGLTALTAGLLEKGAGDRDVFQFAEAVEDVGGSFDVTTDIESVAINGEFLARDRALMVELLADALMRPRFDAQQFDDLRKRNIEFIKAAKDSNPGALAPIYGNAYLFGAHPYARPIGGSEKSLGALTREDVLAQYKSQLGADRLIVAVAGDFAIPDMKARLRKAFGGWRKAGTALPAATGAERQTGRRVLLVDSPGSVQTYFWIGNVGVARRFPERAPLDLVNTLFGGRFTSMLNTELRIKSGLTYGARSRFDRELQAGAFAISSFTQTDKTVDAIDLALATLGRLEKDGVAPDALASAKAYVLGQYPLALETAANWAATIADLEFYGLDRSYIDAYATQIGAVDVTATRSLIDRVYPRGDNLVLVLIGDAAKIRDKIGKYGPVTEMALQQPEFHPAPTTARN
jgi:zinc protease